MTTAKWIHVTATDDLSYGVYQGHGAAVRIEHILPGTRGVVEHADDFTTLVRFDGHDHRYAIATPSAPLALEFGGW